MTSNLDKFRQDLDKLLVMADKLQLTMILDLTNNQELSEKYKDERIIDFNIEYEKWYTEGLYVIKQILPERLDDFIKLYKHDKRKEIDASTYTMSDYLIGLKSTRGTHQIVDTQAGFPKFQLQKGILESATKRFESSLFDIKQILQADIFDSEIDSARELLKNGYERAAGVIVGVVLEKHLSEVCTNHSVKSQKKNPSISDYNDVLKDNDIIDIPNWRFIQHLSDLRNLCGHKRTRDPNKEEVESLIDGVDKVCKTIN